MNTSTLQQVPIYNNNSNNKCSVTGAIKQEDPHMGGENVFNYYFYLLINIIIG